MQASCCNSLGSHFPTLQLMEMASCCPKRVTIPGRGSKHSLGGVGFPEVFVARTVVYCQFHQSLSFRRALFSISMGGLCVNDAMPNWCSQPQSNCTTNLIFIRMYIHAYEMSFLAISMQLMRPAISHNMHCTLKFGEL